jgi:hypothetical protein
MRLDRRLQGRLGPGRVQPRELQHRRQVLRDRRLARGPLRLFEHALRPGQLAGGEGGAERGLLHHRVGRRLGQRRLKPRQRLLGLAAGDPGGGKGGFGLDVARRQLVGLGVRLRRLGLLARRGVGVAQHVVNERVALAGLHGLLERGQRQVGPVVLQVEPGQQLVAVRIVWDAGDVLRRRLLGLLQLTVAFLHRGAQQEGARIAGEDRVKLLQQRLGARVVMGLVQQHSAQEQRLDVVRRERERGVEVGAGRFELAGRKQLVRPLDAGSERGRLLGDHLAE